MNAGDFGHALVADRMQGREPEALGMGGGTYLYWAPECLAVPPRLTSRVDVWAWGISLLQLANGGVVPHADLLDDDGDLTDEFQLELAHGPSPTLRRSPELWSPSFRDFLSQCLEKDPTKRPTATELLRSGFILGVRGETRYRLRPNT